MADSARPLSRRGRRAALSGMTGKPGPSTVTVDVQRLVTGVALVRVSGSIDAGAARVMESELIDATLTGRNHPPCLLLDLSGVTFLDHAGLDALLHFQDRIVAASGTVELLAPSPSVVRLLHEAELDGQSWMSSVAEPRESP